MEFQRETFTFNGIRIVMLTAGKGHPLLLLHGAGTFHGFDFALPWAEHFRVMIPYHPGWGPSDSDPGLSTIHDYVMHYLDLIDHFNLDRVHLVGYSMGGCMAAHFTAEHRRRVSKLVLIAPAFLDVPGHPMGDLSNVPPDQIFGYLTHDPQVVLKHWPKQPTPEFLAERAKENESFLRITDNAAPDPKLRLWLHRINVPTLIVWGELDRITPVGQADHWAKLIPGAKVLRYFGAGHLVTDEKPESVADITKFLLS